MPVKRKSSRNGSKLSRNVKITQNRSKRASQKKRGRKASKRQRGGGKECYNPASDEWSESWNTFMNTEFRHFYKNNHPHDIGGTPKRWDPSDTYELKTTKALMAWLKNFTKQMRAKFNAETYAGTAGVTIKPEDQILKLSAATADDPEGINKYGGTGNVQELLLKNIRSRFRNIDNWECNNSKCTYSIGKIITSLRESRSFPLFFTGC